MDGRRRRPRPQAGGGAMKMDWNDPAARAELIQRVGRSEYMRLQEAHFAATTVAHENGYRIRSIKTRWGLAYIVDGLGRGGYSLNEALEIARTAPPRGSKP